MRAAAAVAYERQLHLRGLGDRLDRLADVRRRLVQLDNAARRQVHAHLDAAERKQIVDEARHALGLARHERQETRARVDVVARRSLQRLDKGAQRSERRAQLVAGIGDEIGAHLRQAVLLGEIAEGDEHVRRGRRRGTRQARHGRRHAPFHRHAFDEVDVDALLRRQRPIDGHQKIGVARHLAHRLAALDLGKHLGGKAVVVHQRARRIERQRSRWDCIHYRPPALALRVARTIADGGSGVPGDRRR